MSLKQNAVDYSETYPLAARAAQESFYVDDGLVGAGSVPEAIELQKQLQELFSKGGFTLRKWRSSEPSTLLHLDPDLLVKQSSQCLPEDDGFAKALGIEWNSVRDCFRLTVSEFPVHDTLSKRALVSDIARTYDVLGWFAPSVVMVKILLKQVWEARIDWDDTVPPVIADTWDKWRRELPLLTNKLIPRCYYPRNMRVSSVQLHGFSDASELAYAAVTYLRVVDSYERVHVSLIMSKTKVAPIRRQSIPRLELCGSHFLASLLDRVRGVLNVPLSNVYAWTDSTVVFHWLKGNPRRFKTFVGNRVSTIMDLIPPNRWHHFKGTENPADSASRGLLPSELLEHNLWWQGPSWLHEPQFDLPTCDDSEVLDTVEEKTCLASVAGDQPVSLLRSWRLCQSLARQVWQRWSMEYVRHLMRFKKWHFPQRNYEVGDLVCLQEDNLVPTKWPLARVVSVHPGGDSLVRVVTVQTPHGTYTRPVSKVALVLSSSD